MYYALPTLFSNRKGKEHKRLNIVQNEVLSSIRVRAGYMSFTGSLKSIFCSTVTY